MSAYEVDEHGRQARSNRTVLPYHVEFKCSHRDVLNYGFRLTEDGSLYLTYEHHIVPPTEYCLGYSQVTDRVVAYICDADFVYMVERARAISIPIFCRASHVASAVCLALALLAYGTLPSLRDDSNYYVKCYMSHQLVSYVFEIAQMITENRRGHTCVLFGMSHLRCYRYSIDSYHNPACHIQYSNISKSLRMICNTLIWEKKYKDKIPYTNTSKSMYKFPIRKNKLQLDPNIILAKV